MKRSFDGNIFRGIITHSCKSGFLALAVLGFLPVQVSAQVFECNATIEADAVGGPLFFINEPITISIDLGAGVVSGGQGDPKDFLDIDSFTYLLDCAPGDTFPNCTVAGNTVSFDASSVQTNCVDSNGAAIVFDTAVASGEVTFTPDSSLPIRNFSEQSCNVSFDVTVTGVSGDNLEKEIVELTGWAGPGNAVCDNGLTASAAASISFDLSTIVSSFWVTKDFVPDNSMEVEVFISCNDGLPLTSSQVITEDSGGVVFIVKLFTPGNLDCEITEVPVPGGYNDSYNASALDGEADFIGNVNGCQFEEVDGGNFKCEITNTAMDAIFEVTKVWDVIGQGGDRIDQTFDLTISCTEKILSASPNPDSGPGQFQGRYLVRWVGLEGNTTVSVTVDSSNGTARCRAEEQIFDDSVEIDNPCRNDQSLTIGQTTFCTISNTVFFEGIPALSRYSLVLLALLMLGIGMVGFRRFA